MRLIDLNEEESIDYFISLQPYLKKKWKAYTQEDYYDLDNRSPYCEISELARLTLEICDDNEQISLLCKNLEQVFFESNNPDVIDLGYGFIESLTSLMQQSGIKFDKVKENLMSNSIAAHNEIIEFWSNYEKHHSDT